ncbi:MAG TPA: FtsX-like permease family protein [Ignavibacteriaceae bacterium]|nr:FtsX-like permease family protein [Ignavibacteriaceae bacterium]
MLIKLAWRNIWRNRRRSLIVLTSVVVGLVAIVISDGLSNGMIGQMLFNQINLNISHIQIHKKGFNNNKTVKNFISDYKKVDEVLKDDPSIKSYSKRVFITGILSSANNSSGVNIYGIDPEQEAKVSIIKNSMIEGSYLTKNKRDIIIGEKLAEKLEVEIGDKVVAMANTLKGNIGSEVFRVVGIFKTASSKFDKTAIYIPAATEQNMLNIGDKYYEYAVITKDYDKVDETQKYLEAKLGDSFEVLSYKDLLPMLIYQIELYKETMWILNVIIGLALIFGIINSMLMSVFERIREFGVLMSIGMKNSRIYLMIVTEAFIIGIVGTIVGIIVGLLLEIPLAHTGIDLSFFSSGLEAFGIGTVIYPVLSIGNIMMSSIFMPFVAILGALYPAYKAIKLEPIYAIYYV